MREGYERAAEAIANGAAAQALAHLVTSSRGTAA
jgi:anthranilate phosphoribosyltransferase